MRCLVTGASGFVGSRLCRALVGRGDQVSTIVIPNCNLDQLRSIESRINVFIHDGEQSSLSEIVQKAKPDVVFHLASMVLGDHTPELVKPLITANILFGTQLLEAMLQNGVTRFINTGTYWQHFHAEVYNPVNLYAATKQAFADLLRFYVETVEISAITLELFDNYGPDDPRPKLISLLRKAANTGETLNMSPGEQLVDMVHIDDIVEAYITASQRLLANHVKFRESYAVNTCRAIKLQEIVKIAEYSWNKPIHINWGARPYRQREVMSPWTHLDWLPGWKPTISLELGLKQIS